MEKKIGEKWIAVNSRFNWERHYTLFGFLAQVRDRDIYSLGEAKGFPEDFEVVHLRSENIEYFHPLENHLELSYRKMSHGGMHMGDFGFTWHTFRDILDAEVLVQESMRKYLDFRYYDSIFDLSYFFDIIREMVESLSEDNGNDLRIVIGFNN